MARRTKIVCTLGPAVDSKAKIKALISAGMNVARINCSHGDWPTRERWVRWIKELQPKVAPVGILIDLQGPKFRIGEIAGGSRVLKTNAALTVANKGKCDLTVPDLQVWDSLKKGDRILLGDGGVEIKIVAKKGKALSAKAVSGGTVRSRQGLTVVGRSFRVPALTDKDRADLKKALELDADFVALSYVRRGEDLKELRRLINKKDRSIKTVAKVETRDALENIEEIVKESDVVMVARGDLGLQMDLEGVPVAQKRIIAVCNERATPVITATQMLESMVASPRPTRAEASDVANAILDGTDAVMLSAETATGAYPIEAVKTMARIAQSAEPMVHFTAKGQHDNADTETDSVAHAAVGIAAALSVKAILTSSTSGLTPRLVSRYRPSVPVLCVSWNARTHRQLSVVWGVESVTEALPETTDEAVERTVRAFLRLNRIRHRDKVVVTAGVPAGVPGNTNMILVLDV
ncbi:MAG: pyruvate kinase [Fimbriimonadaceae bacterium]